MVSEPLAVGSALDQPRLVWPGRDDNMVALCDGNGTLRLAPRDSVPTPILTERLRVGAGRDLVIHGDNYPALDALLADGWGGRARLAYIDPPFNTGRRFEHYDDAYEQGLYLTMLRDRLVLLRELLARDGSIVVHLDDRQVHLVRLLLDEIFGPANFRNSIVVKRVTKNVQRQFRRIQALPQAHDVCLWYSVDPATRYPLPLLPRPGGPRHPEGYWKDFWSTADRPTMRYELLGVRPSRGQWKWSEPRARAAVEAYRRYEAEGGGRSVLEFWREHGGQMEFIRRNERGRIVHWVPPDGRLCATTLWTDISAYSFRQGFPTEKNERLLARFVELFTAPGDLVVDAFAGSGTTGAAAAALGRRWVLIEQGPQVYSHIVPRLAAVASEGFRVCELT